MFASEFSWFRLIPAIDKDVLFHRLGIAEHSVADASHHAAPTFVHLHAWLSVLVLIGFAVAGRLALERAKQRPGIQKYFASDTFGVLSFAEVFVGGIQGLMSDLLDRADVRRFFPLIAGLFAYIFTCNIQGILPGFLPPTSNINANVGMALISFLTFNAVGLSRDPVGYMKHLAGPVLLLVPLLLPIEIVSLFIRPLSLTVRLTVNLFGDHQVFSVMSGIIPIILPSLLLVLAMVVSVVQSFVFSLLTVVYIHLSLPHHEHDDAHAAAHH